MKKLLFIPIFTFIGLQSFSQIYLVTLSDYYIGSCPTQNELTLTKITPTGAQSHVCIPSFITDGALISLNQELNSIVIQGYKLIETNNGNSETNTQGWSWSNNGLINNSSLNVGTSWYFAIP
ncbi:MAG: hypothetical protein ACKVJA_00225 [Flavobacteriales bacterium]